jgi:hypothetical protein
MITAVHRALDDRIFHKECIILTEEGCRVILDALTNDANVYNLFEFRRENDVFDKN